MKDILKELSAPFPPAQISWRVGPVDNKDNPTKGIALAYLDARDVQDRLDAVCGTLWQSRYPHAAAKTVCEIGIKIGDEWVWRSDGAGDTDMEAEKGSLSDAFKRAAVKWGIGRYLYDAKSPWVQVVKKGRSVVIADHEFAKLEKLLPGSKAETAPPITEAQANAAYSKPPEVDKQKNPPGRSAVITKLREYDRDVRGCSDKDELLAMLAQDAFKAFAFKVCLEYPTDWLGPEDNSGLSGCIASRGVELKCHDETDNWIARMERARDAKNQQQAAE